MQFPLICELSSEGKAAWQSKIKPVASLWWHLICSRYQKQDLHG